MILNRYRGHFLIRLDYFNTALPDIIELMKDVVVVKADYSKLEAAIIYIGISEKYFDPINQLVPDPVPDDEFVFTPDFIPSYIFIFTPEGIKCEKTDAVWI